MIFEPHKADDCPYWKTSKSSPGTWIDRTRSMIEDAGGTIEGCGEMTKMAGSVVYVISFRMDGERFMAAWPVLQSKYTGDEAAARRQAATMLHHDVKNRLVAAKVHGVRIAFFHWLSLPDGRTVEEVVRTGTQKLALPAPAEKVA